MLSKRRMAAHGPEQDEEGDDEVSSPSTWAESVAGTRDVVITKVLARLRIRGKMSRSDEEAVGVTSNASAPGATRGLASAARGPPETLSAPELKSLNNKAQQFFGVEVTSTRPGASQESEFRVQNASGRPRPPPAIGSAPYEARFDEVHNKRLMQFKLAFPHIRVETTIEEFYEQAVRCEVPFAQLDNFMRMRILDERKLFYLSDLS